MTEQTGTCGDCGEALYEGPEQQYCDDCDTRRVDEAFDTARAIHLAESNCAWCEAETGIRTEGSHGICERHQLQVIAEYEAYKAAEVAR